MNKRGFTLLEIMIVLVIMAIFSAVVIPNIPRMQPRYEREQFIARLNALVQLGWQQAIIEHRVCKVVFDFGKSLVSLHVATAKKEQIGEPKFKPIKGLYLSTSFTLPDNLKVRQFFIEGFDEMARFVGKKTAEVWFYIMPEGLAQDVILNLFDMKDRRNTKPRPISLVLNPFSAQFKVYDEFQKP